MMKAYLLALFLFPTFLFAQFDYYGPEPFDEILDNSFNQAWTPSALTSIENKKKFILLDQATMSTAVMLNYGDKSVLEMNAIDSVHGSGSTYGSLLRSIFQLEDANTHKDNDSGAQSGPYFPLAGQYKVSPFLHSYYGMNGAASGAANSTDGGSYYIKEATNSGYLLIEFAGTASSTTIKAVSKWEYSAALDSVVETTGWTTQWLMNSGSSLSWTPTMANATNFFLADANDLLDLEITSSSDFNPEAVTYKTNATAAIPAVDSIENSKILTGLMMDLDISYWDQLGHLASATAAATTMLDSIESTLISAGASLRYPKQFYLDLRANMLSHKIACDDIYNARTGYENIAHVYFTNAADDNGVPHPFMVVASHAVSTRPNLLIDVNRPPGSLMGVGYAQSPVTRNGKLGEFLVKIPLKDYGLINTLLDNDLSPYGDLATDFDAAHGTTTTKDVYNYVALASCGIAVDGVTIYPAYNNNLRFAVEDAEVTSSGIHVGGGLELHYHADGHAFNGNGINLYNLPDYAGHDHPPVIGASYDGIALFGKYETSQAAMAGYSTPLDQYGGHDHGDGFGYHYHAHTQNVTSNVGSIPFDEHFLLVGAWKGSINNIPGFNEGKMNQLKEASIARYAGASYVVGITKIDNDNPNIALYPNPNTGEFVLEVTASYTITIYDATGKIVTTLEAEAGANHIAMPNVPAGMYLLKGSNRTTTFAKKVLINNK